MPWESYIFKIIIIKKDVFEISNNYKNCCFLKFCAQGILKPHNKSSNNNHTFRIKTIEHWGLPLTCLGSIKSENKACLNWKCILNHYYRAIRINMSKGIQRKYIKVFN